MTMTKLQKQYLVADIAELIDEWTEEYTPKKIEPFAFPCSRRNGFWVIVSEQDDDSVFVPWKDFEKRVLDSDDDVLRKYLPRFQKLIRKMEKWLIPTAKKP